MLSETELALLQMRADGFSEKEIAAKRGRSEHTIKTQFNDIRRKMKLHSIIHVVAEAFRKGWIR